MVKLSHRSMGKGSRLVPKVGPVRSNRQLARTQTSSGEARGRLPRDNQMPRSECARSECARKERALPPEH